MTPEILEKYNSITPESLDFKMNPNVFIPGLVADKDAEILAQDEETARELARYLWNQVHNLTTKDWF